MKRTIKMKRTIETKIIIDLSRSDLEQILKDHFEDDENAEWSFSYDFDCSGDVIRMTKTTGGHK